MSTGTDELLADRLDSRTAMSVVDGAIADSTAYDFSPTTMNFLFGYTERR